MKSFFLLPLLLSSYLSANHYNSDSPEFLQSVTEGKRKATEELSQIKSSVDIITNLVSDLKSEAQKLSQRLAHPFAQKMERERRESEFIKRSRVDSEDSVGSDVSEAEEDDDREKKLFGGWLKKQKYRHKSEWPERWVVLTNKRLIYYEDENEEHRINNVKKEGFTLLNQNERKPLELVIKIGMKKWHFLAENSEDRAKWQKVFTTWKPLKYSTRMERIAAERKAERDSIEASARATDLELQIANLKSVLQQQLNFLATIRTDVANTSPSLTRASDSISGFFGEGSDLKRLSSREMSGGNPF